MSSRMSATIFSSRDWLESTVCMVPQLLLELAQRHVVEALGLGLKPLVDLGLRRDVLVDVPRLVAQIQHHPSFTASSNL